VPNSLPARGLWRSAGYEELLEVLADPEHEDHDHFLSWVGGRFDPAEFDLGSVNARLQRVR
jgi:hypothetical protein